MRLFVFAAATLLLVGCATPPQEPDPPRYWDLPTSRVLPETEGERATECGRIRDEMARVQSIAQAVGARAVAAPRQSGPFQTFSYAQATGPAMAAAIQAKAARSLAHLETRAAEVGCRAAFSDAPDLRWCVTQCQDLTSRTAEQCFDVCR